MFYKDLSRQDFNIVADTFITFEQNQIIYNLPAILNRTEQLLLKFSIVIETTESIAELFVLDIDDLIKVNSKFLCEGENWKVIRIISNFDGIKQCMVAKLDQPAYSKELKKER
ncbi:MAG: hypothetical protein QXV44_02415 [Candidatus Anstonellaceae archaeon]